MVGLFFLACRKPHSILRTHVTRRREPAIDQLSCPGKAARQRHLQILGPGPGQQFRSPASGQVDADEQAGQVN
jgi:hypothetical protein